MFGFPHIQIVNGQPVQMMPFAMNGQMPMQGQIPMQMIMNPHIPQGLLSGAVGNYGLLPVPFNMHPLNPSAIPVQDMNTDPSATVQPQIYIKPDPYQNPQQMQSLSQAPQAQPQTQPQQSQPQSQPAQLQQAQLQQAQLQAQLQAQFQAQFQAQALQAQAQAKAQLQQAQSQTQSQLQQAQAQMQAQVQAQLQQAQAQAQAQAQLQQAQAQNQAQIQAQAQAQDQAQSQAQQILPKLEPAYQTPQMNSQIPLQATTQPVQPQQQIYVKPEPQAQQQIYVKQEVSSVQTQVHSPTIVSPQPKANPQPIEPQVKKEKPEDPKVKMTYQHSTQFKYWTFTNTQLEEIRKKKYMDALRYVKDPNARLTVEEEKHFLWYFEGKMTEIARGLQCSSRVSLTALVYFKRFYLFHSGMLYDPILLLYTCLYLASKVEEERKEITVFAESKHGIRVEDIAWMEFDLFNGLKFHLEVYLPGTSLDGFFWDFQQFYKVQVSSTHHTKAHELVSIALLSDAIFLYSPGTVALSALVLSSMGTPEEAAIQEFLNKRVSQSVPNWRDTQAKVKFDVVHYFTPRKVDTNHVKSALQKNKLLFKKK
eukprot:TRINITY_DN2923_c0_g1_i1.p1 TRINITY_DN2923_c0_g1~~TRINITY_DN2923_c0_g1_i1.p1  ORF type:complete len:642 (+),score=150.74 TRINITY_DN2923_c0_g1_i1:158-1927(+)